ncbi:MAG: hypothetical protein M3071_07895 [Actinomycetota bacterium]|nr:hypothetical protein [Actinomycetota bacterium]
MDTEDLTEIERAGRRCAVCHSGRGWRRFAVIRADDREPMVLCASCRARFGDALPVGRKTATEPSPPAPKTEPRPTPRARRRPTEQRPDRLRAALEKLPASFSTAMAAKAAGLGNERTLARLQDLEREGKVRRVGKRWTTEAPPTDLTAAIDRLEARTSNLRIIRERTPVG